MHAISNPKIKFSCRCLKLDYVETLNMTDEAVRKCIGMYSGYDYCSDVHSIPEGEEELYTLPGCYVCFTDLCNSVSRVLVPFFIVFSLFVVITLT